MKGLVIFLASVAVALSAQPRSIANDAVSICRQENSDDVLLPHEKCNRFYKCNGGSPAALDCPAGLVYNVAAEICDWPANVDCGDRTLVEGNGSNNDNNGNNENNGNNGVWEPEHGYDDPSQASTICAADESDGILVAHENCNQFYKCLEGKPLALSCPLSLKYNPKLEACDWPNNVNCAGRD